MQVEAKPSICVKLQLKTVVFLNLVLPIIAKFTFNFKYITALTVKLHPLLEAVKMKTLGPSI